MHSSPAPLVTGPWSAFDHSCWQQAGLAIRAALQAAETAAAILTPLPGETQWASGGVRALHETLLHLREQAATVLSSLRRRESEWERGGLA